MWLYKELYIKEKFTGYVDYRLIFACSKVVLYGHCDIIVY